MHTATPLSPDQDARAYPWWHQAGLFVERHRVILGVVLVCLYLLAAAGEARNKYIWYDELVTVKVASLPSNGAILHFFNTGRDTTSATCALIDHAALKLPIDPELAARLPFALAFTAMLVLVYLFMHRRYPAAYALAAPVLLFARMRVRDLGVEARGYALLMTGTALAMFCWQTATNKTERRFPSLLGLWFGLALAINAHTFGILLFVPFALAELWRDYHNRRVDWPVWIALFLFPLGLVPVIHGQLLAGKYYGRNFWAQPHMRDLLTLVEHALYFVNKRILLLLVLALVLVYLGRRPLLASVRRGRAGGFTTAEWILVVALAVLPLYAVPFSFLIHVYRNIYVIEFAVGCAIVLSALAAQLGGRSEQVGTVFLTIVLLYTVVTARELLASGVQAFEHPRLVHAHLVQRFNAVPWVRYVDQSDLPLVTSEHLTYSIFSEYGNADAVRRLRVLTDLPDVKDRPSSETAQKNLLAFGPSLGFQTEDVRQYLPTHPHFLLAGKPDVGDWITGHLQELQRNGEATLSQPGIGFKQDPVVKITDVQVTPAGVASFDRSPQ